MTDKRITRNAVRCNYCGFELESFHRHDMKWHSCGIAPIETWRRERAWVDDAAAPGGMQLVETGELEPPRFAVDGGLAYLRRVGDQVHYTDISEYES